MFLADVAGIYAQHAAMWSIYADSIKILVSVTSLPILVASLLLSLKGNANAETAVDLVNLPPILAATLVLVPIIDLLLLGVVIHHRLVILVYARWLNGCRAFYIGWWDEERAKARQSPVNLPMNRNEAYPEFLEPAGPMGLIVHGSALVNAIYAFGAARTYLRAACPALLIAGAVFVLYECWYWRNCHQAQKSWNHSRPAPAVAPSPPAAPTP